MYLGVCWDRESVLRTVDVTCQVFEIIVFVHEFVKMYRRVRDIRGLSPFVLGIKFDFNVTVLWLIHDLLFLPISTIESRVS